MLRFVRSLIRIAQSIDPTYCDVHQQYAHVYFQQGKFIDFEEETVNALICKFTMGQAMNNWNRYWEVVLRQGDVRAKERYDRYMKRIKDEVAQAGKEDVEASGGNKNNKKKERSRGSAGSTQKQMTMNEL